MTALADGGLLWRMLRIVGAGVCALVILAPAARGLPVNPLPVPQPTLPGVPGGLPSVPPSVVVPLPVAPPLPVDPPPLVDPAPPPVVVPLPVALPLPVDPPPPPGAVPPPVAVPLPAAPAAPASISTLPGVRAVSPVTGLPTDRVMAVLGSGGVTVTGGRVSAASPAPTVAIDEPVPSPGLLPQPGSDRNPQGTRCFLVTTEWVGYPYECGQTPATTRTGETTGQVQIGGISLARTGADIGAVIGAGVLLLGVGASFLRRRPRVGAPAPSR